MLNNKNIVITGCNRGIGYSIALECMKNGANVWGCMRKNYNNEIEELSSKAKIYNVEFRFIELDLSKEESIENASRIILKDKKKIDGIVNNAGIVGSRRLFSMTNMQDIKEVFQVNFFGPMYFTQRLLRNMMKNKDGNIVNISSIAALDGDLAQFEYISSKAALIGATKKLSNELAQFGIRLNAVAPGMANTDMIYLMDADYMKEMLNNISLKRLAKPEEIANLVIFLLSEKSSFITGQTIRIDGGRK